MNAGYAQIVPWSFKSRLTSPLLQPDLKRLEAERAAMAEEFQQVTRDWLDAQDSDLLSEQRIRISKRMRAHYFGLDPFIRGRGAYHRLGNIVGK